MAKFTLSLLLVVCAVCVLTETVLADPLEGRDDISNSQEEVGTVRCAERGSRVSIKERIIMTFQ